MTAPPSERSLAPDQRGTGSRAPRRLVKRARAVLLKPLTLAQISSSAAGALAMLAAAVFMQPAQFAVFSLLTLASTMLTGLQRAALLQPALIHQRHSALSFVPFRYALVGAVVTALALVAVALHVGVHGPVDLALLGVTGLAPAFYDWLRFRAMGSDRRWLVALGDGVRMVATLAALAVPAVRTDAVALQAWSATAVVLPVIVMVVRLPRLSEWLSYREYVRDAGWQLVDFLFGQTLITLPLLVLGGTAAAALISGLRLAQSVLGPLNLVFSAGTTNLVADGATRHELATNASLIRRGSRLAKLLSLTSVVCVLTLLGFFALSSVALRGVGREALVLGLVLVGGSLVTTGWAGVHAVVLRLLRHQALVTICRGIVSAVTATAFVLGYVLDGAEASLIAGFAAIAVSTPLTFGLAARSKYKDALP